MPVALGLIPLFLSPLDLRPAAMQINENYAHGGGWRPMDGWEFFANDHQQIKYFGDPALFPFARATLSDETIFVYPHAWMLIQQPSGDFEISRLD
jgi:hypothetical protein